MTTLTTTTETLRGASYRAASQHNDPYATYRRLDKKFENLLAKFGVDATVTPAMLRRSAAALYRWDPHPGSQVSDKDRAERAIECRSWTVAKELARAFNEHAETLGRITETAARARRGNENIPSAINDCQIAAKALNEAWAAVRAGDLGTAQKLRLETARYLSMVAGLLQGHGLDSA
jgi:hypothetical protein